MEDWSVERVADRMQIHEVLYRYCRAIDRLQLDWLTNEVFHADALIDKSGDPVPLAAWIAEVARRHPGVPQASHMVMNPIVEFTGPHAAFVESWCLASERHPAETGDVDDVFRLRYGDVFERRAGRWKILRRSFVMDQVIRIPREAMVDPLPGPRLQGRRDATDPLLRQRAIALGSAGEVAAIDAQASVRPPDGS
jgi:hypothetical protein